MKPFRFNLEKVLKVRQVETLKAKQALAKAQLTSGQAWVVMEKARTDRTAFEAAWEERRSSQRQTVREWTESSQRHAAMVEAEKAAVEALHQALAAVAEKRAELEEAERKEQALLKLREQQEAAHDSAERAEEQATTDEIAQNTRRSVRGVG